MTHIGWAKYFEEKRAYIFLSKPYSGKMFKQVDVHENLYFDSLTGLTIPV